MKQDQISIIGHLVEESRNSIIDIEEVLRKKNPKWKKDKDARLTLFNKYSTVLATVSINLVLLERYLSKEEWWLANSYILVSDDSKKLFLKEYEMFNRIGLIHFIFSSVESSFRLFLSAIDKDACNRGRSDFKNIYDHLLDRLQLAQYITLLDLWRHIRNCLHNNGLFLPKNYKDIEIEFKGLKYNFIVGKPLDFVNTTLVVELLPDIVKMSKDVVESRLINNLDEIIDLSA
jgi:hypothetical protein